MDKKLVFVSLAALAVMLVFAVMLATGAVLFLSNPSMPAQKQAAPSAAPQQANPAPSSATGASAQQKLEQDWALISKANVEKACLSNAKKEAAAMGYNEGVVFSCSCNAQESAGSKSYDCTISALDGGHAAGIACEKSLQSCTITSQIGTATYTFAQLQAMAD